MSVLQMGEVWKLELPYNKAWVLMAMADHAHDDGTECFAGVRRLAWKTGYGDRQVRRVLHDLREDGIIEAVAFAYGGQRPTKYTLHFDRAVKKAPLTYEADPPVKMSETPGVGVRTPDIAKASEPSTTIKQPSEEPSVRIYAREPWGDSWGKTLRAIGGWEEKGEPHTDSLLAWIEKRDWSADQLEASAIGLAATSEKTLKGYRNLAAAFQRRLNEGYDRVPLDGRQPEADRGRETSGRAAGWDNNPDRA